tara:strand:+ start:812 stop:1483 length:672 start_codon:yes stop_codon:yes gene_type:complete
MNKDDDLEYSFLCAYKEFREAPMKKLYEHPIAGIPSRARVKIILNEIGDLRGKRVLDIGCEGGYISSKILLKNPFELYAIDICDEALNEFREKVKLKGFGKKIVIKKGFLQKLPFEDGFFDFVICSEVIEHAPYLDKGFEEINRVLKKRGKLILTFPIEHKRRKVYWIAKMFGINVDAARETTLFEYSRDEIKGKLKNYFNIEKQREFPFPYSITNLLVCERI